MLFGEQGQEMRVFWIVRPALMALSDGAHVQNAAEEGQLGQDFK